MSLRRIVLNAVLLIFIWGGVPLSAQPGAAPENAASYLKRAGLPPLEYVSKALREHPIVILGEGHWIRHDAELVRDLVPMIAREHIVLASELFPSERQAEIDALIAGAEWDVSAAMKIMRAAAWPYVEYLDILRMAWKEKAVILALGPPRDWRERRIDYDRFMAERVIEARNEGQKRFLIYCGLHHAFTRYHQPELDLDGNAWAYMDRAGNILMRQYGRRVFLITLHRPVWCGRQEPWGYCLPLDGEIDCAATNAAGFDTGPLAERKISPLVYYARGHPALRFGDMTDGYIWFKPIEQYQLVSLIPLSEFAPDDESLAEVIANPPFGGKELTREVLEEQWIKRASSLENPMQSRGWTALEGWRETCGKGDTGRRVTGGD